MKISIAAVMLVWTFQALARGPALGPAADVTVTGRGVDNVNDAAAAFCKGFDLSPAKAKKILNGAAIVTYREIHDYYDFLPCYVRGNANFHGYPATWEIRAGGTGVITLMGGESFPIADEKQRSRTR
jgi:hypothetical protein